MSENAQPQPILERIKTGISGFDTICGGGLMPGSLQLLVGPPGAGKTIFANQFAFHFAALGHTAIYVTLLAESHARMLSHLGGFAFFNPNLVSRHILYMSGHSTLEQGGLDGLLELLTSTIRENNASLLIIDNLNAAREFAQTTTTFKRFLLRLATSTSLTNCTTILTSLLTRMTETEAERGTVDGIIRLDKRAYGARVVRELMVEKMRATSYALGVHAVEIDVHGLHVYPRLESLRTEPVSSTRSQRRIAFGIPGLDAMLGGGVPEGSATNLVGPSGTGKTLLGSSFLAAGLRQDERALYVGLREPPEQVIAQAEAIGLRLAEPLARGMLHVLWFPTLETSIDGVAWELLTVIEKEKVKRVFIDGIDGFQAMLVYPERLPRFSTALMTRLASLGCTTVMSEIATTQDGGRDHAPVGVADNVLVLSESMWLGRVRRLVTSRKLQAGPHDISPRCLSVSSRGLTVNRPWFHWFHEDKL